ncbi:aldo/keto reductase [Paenibacillus sp. YPG26]|uniref:aldo/keto reductase n=1 Tax=Paenibacillus sp. YPG26 TaxID=2878915 RepID=UPI0020414D00|nr:aldo/keto reductase [Paenibacillus sp. YPG26]USB33715.1 aldo/keto reductase [Paenibacillus sp. YPG26]
METRRLGKSDLHTSVIGFGAWAAGKAGWGDVSDNQIERAIHRAHELGVNFFDTAPVYGFGESEQIVGRTLKPIRDKVILATKFGLTWDDAGSIRNDVSRENIVREVEDSLRRLQTDYIDLYQVHWPDPSGATPFEETFDTLNQLAQQGKIRYIGVSNFSVEQLTKAAAISPVVSLQSLYNILQRDVEQGPLPYAAEKGIGFIPYSPLAQGLLTGKFNPGNKPKEDDVRSVLNPLFGEAEYELNLTKVQKLSEIAGRYGKPLGQLAINWLLANPAVSSVIAGAKTAEQVEENAGAAQWKITAEDVEEINQLLLTN